MDAVLYTPKARTFPIPKAVSERAREALGWKTAFAEVEVDPVAVYFGSMLAAGGSFTLDNIQLIDDFFASRPMVASGPLLDSSGVIESAALEASLWGGRPARAWASKILEAHQGVVASVADAALEKIRYNDSQAYLGLIQTDGAGEEIVRHIVRTDGSPYRWESLTAAGEWEPFKDVRGYEAVQMDREMVGFVASAFMEGVDGVVLVYGEPITYLPKAMTAAAAPIADDVASALTYAVVDDVDQTAVMNVIKISPGPKVFTRKMGKWELDGDMLGSLKGVSPPKLVELDDALAASVVQQVDTYDSANKNNAGTEKEPVIDPQTGMQTYEVKDHPNASKPGKQQAGTVVAAVQELQSKMTSVELARMLTIQKMRDEEAGRRAEYTAQTEKLREIWDDLGEEAPDKMVALRRSEMLRREQFDRELSERDADFAEEYDSVRTELAVTASAAAALLSDWNSKSELYLESMTAAVSARQNRGNAETLRRYWLYGKGALKIRWGTAGDWTRCYRQLRKYLGVRAKGYCALRHKQATGMWTGDKRHRRLHGK